MCARVYALLLLSVFMVSACSLAEQRQALEGPENLLLVFESPRRGKTGVGERWVVARQGDQTFLLHAWDVERRRTRQSCGAVPRDAFVAGWEGLDAAGLLVSGDDLRLVPSPEGEPFAGRLQLSFDDQGRRVSARRPLPAGNARALLRVLRGWEATLLPAAPTSLPAELRVEVAIGGCGLPKAKGRKPGRVAP